MSNQLLYLSDQAYDVLWRGAVAAKYIPRGAERGKGLSNYIAELSRCQFEDDRPYEYKEMDDIRRADGLTLYWSDGDIRKARMLKLDEETIERLCSIAIDFRIGIGKSHRVNKVVIRSTTTTIAKVLEAIGKRWLVPITGVETKKSSRELHAD